MCPKVSVIVPVYKAEKYLHRCVDSIIAQTFKDWELLLVDDGSPDNSGKLCDEYAQKDSRIKVFHKKNGGVSSARQMGLDNATGEYTIHADPDDWVEPTMLEELYAKAIEDNADMVICDYFQAFKHKQVYTKQNIKSLENDSILRQILMHTMSGAVWNKLVKRSTIVNNKIKFPPITFCEDTFFICDLLRFKQNISYLNKAFYHYDQALNSSSLTRFMDKSTIDSRIYFVSYFSSFLNKNDYEQELLSAKITTKRLAWYVKEYTFEEYKSIYPETNDFFKNRKSFNADILINLSLKGYHRLSKIIYSFSKIRNFILLKVKGF